MCIRDSYIADYTGNRLVVLDLNGACVATNNTSLSRPTGIAVNNNYIFVGNSGSSIQTFSRASNNYHGSQSLSSSDLAYVWGMSFNSAGNRLIVSNYYPGKISEFSTSGDGSVLSLVRKMDRSRLMTDTGYDSNGNIYSTEHSALRLSLIHI